MMNRARILRRKYELASGIGAADFLKACKDYL